MNGKQLLLALGLSAGLVGAAGAVPYPSASTPAPADLGAARAVSGEESITATVALQLRNTEEMEALLASMYTRGSPQFRKFLSTQEFSARFGPSDETVARVTRRLQSAGLQVTRASPTLLKVKGSTSAMEAAFGVTLHAYQVPASAAGPGYRYRAPVGTPQAPADIAPSVQAVLGLDTRPRFRPHARQAVKTTAVTPAATAPNTPNPTGLWTVADLAQYYNVNPLYQQGLQGRRQTIGIMTFASFTPSDALAYWSSLGLPVASNRIQVVNVDGGSGPPSDVAGSIETTLDVEQSGGIAPAANIIVYEAPNTNQGIVDLFATAFEANTADTLSISWGDWEYLEEVTVKDPLTHRNGDLLKVMNDLLIQAALQGQSVYAAAGDTGAYDANNPFGSNPLPNFSLTLSVDSPASEPWITAAGGTTLPGPQQYILPGGSSFWLNVTSERAWSWDYQEPLCQVQNLDPLACGIYPIGGGGGVSIVFPRPFYQFLVPGMRNSEPGQALSNLTTTPPQLIYPLPANFPGRNLPDISMNADPETGYVIWYTSDTTGFGIQYYWGGTSFVAPQLNGITALYDQGLGTRIGFLNPALYDLALSGKAYTGQHPPLRDITTGNNWFYTGQRGYDLATGVGVPDVTNLFNALR